MMLKVVFMPYQSQNRSRIGYKMMNVEHDMPVVRNIKWYCTAHYSALILNALNVKALNDHCICVYVAMTCNNAEI